MEHRARSSEVAKFHRDGFFVRDSVFGAEELEELRDAVEQVGRRVVEAQGRSGSSGVERVEGKRYERVLGASVKWDWAEGSTGIRSMEPFHHLHPCLDELVDDPRLWAPVLDLIEVDSVSLFTDKLNFKRPGGAPFPWHQDTPYWAFGCDHIEQLVSVGLYLDDATEENGCLWMLRGSHRHGILPPPRAAGVLNRLYTDVGSLKGVEAVPAQAPAGSVFFFHAHIVHGSAPNRTDRSRRAVYFTYQPGGFPRWQSEESRPSLPA
jgi:hypothetical protein